MRFWVRLFGSELVCRPPDPKRLRLYAVCSYDWRLQKVKYSYTMGQLLSCLAGSARARENGFCVAFHNVAPGSDVSSMILSRAVRHTERTAVAGAGAGTEGGS